MYIYHIFFIHSSVDGHLGSFHSLAIVDTAAINIRVHMPLQITTFLSLLLLLKILFIYLTDRDPKQAERQAEREEGREAGSLLSREPMRGWIPGPWEHDLS